MNLNDRIRKIEKTIAEQNFKFKVVSSDGSIHTVNELEALQCVFFNYGESKFDVVMITAADINNQDAVDYANLLNVINNAMKGIKNDEN